MVIIEDLVSDTLDVEKTSEELLAELDSMMEEYFEKAKESILQKKNL